MYAGADPGDQAPQSRTEIMKQFNDEQESQRANGTAVSGVVRHLN